MKETFSPFLREIKDNFTKASMQLTSHHSSLFRQTALKNLPKLPQIKDKKLSATLFSRDRIGTTNIIDGKSLYNASQLFRMGRATYKFHLTKYLLLNHPRIKRPYLTAAREKFTGSEIITEFDNYYYSKSMKSENDNSLAQFDTKGLFFSYIGALHLDEAVELSTLDQFFDDFHSQILEMYEMLYIPLVPAVGVANTHKVLGCMRDLQSIEGYLTLIKSERYRKKISCLEDKLTIMESLNVLHGLLSPRFKPEYRVVFFPQMDDDRNHDVFEVECVVDNKVLGRGADTSLKIAKNRAAHDVLKNNRVAVELYLKHIKGD